MIQLSGLDIRFIILHGIRYGSSRSQRFCEPFRSEYPITVLQPTESLNEEAGII